MSDWDTLEHVSTRSVIRHRPIVDTKPPMGKRSYVTTATPPVVQRASRPRRADVTGEYGDWRKTGDDARTQELPEPYTNPGTRRLVPSSRAVVQVKAQSKPAPVTQETERLADEPQRRIHPLLFLGIIMLGMVALWGIFSSGLAWVNTTLDDYRYGRTRTYHTDAFVGHNEENGIESHFIAVNLKGHIEVIELPGGDPAKARIYVGPQLFGANNDLVVVTLEFKDVNGDKKPDMLVNFQGSRVVFLNEKGGFRSLTQQERQQVEKFFTH